MIVFLDTHAAIYLWEGRIERFGAAAGRLMEVETMVASPVIRLELAFLSEIGKLKVAPDTLLGDLAFERGVLLVDDPLPRVVDRALALCWTRDPFDRLVVAHADLHESPLITRDRLIQENYARAVW